MFSLDLLVLLIIVGAVAIIRAAVTERDERLQIPIRRERVCDITPLLHRTTTKLTAQQRRYEIARRSSKWK
jgi:hypothetical protein